MEIAELINSIASKQGCEVMKREQPIDLSEYSLPADLNYYLSNYNGIKLFTDKPFGITIVGFDDFKVTNKILEFFENFLLQQDFLAAVIIFQL